jgi:hypothetical protein
MPSCIFALLQGPLKAKDTPGAAPKGILAYVSPYTVVFKFF